VIVRVLRAKVRAGKVGAFNAIFRQQVTELRGQPGLVYVKLARRLAGDGSEDVVLFEEWRDAASLYAWVGPNLAEPRLVPGARELMDELIVAHYEALDMDGLGPPGEGSAWSGHGHASGGERPPSGAEGGVTGGEGS
jgi:hypothetical protein